MADHDSELPLNAQEPAREAGAEEERGQQEPPAVVPLHTDKFDPRQYLTKMRGGRDYLEVKWRLLWLRLEHPDADVRAELMEIKDLVYEGGEVKPTAIARAEITIPNGGGHAVDWGTETPDDFGDYIEKALTKATGRALALLGYGTQFSGADVDEGSGTDGERNVVDSPARRQGGAGVQQRASEKQVRAIYASAAEVLAWSDDDTALVSLQRYKKRPEDLSRQQASAFIDAIKAKKAGDPREAREALQAAAQQAATRPVQGETAQPEQEPTDQVEAIRWLALQKGVNLTAYLKNQYDTEDPANLTEQQAAALLKTLRAVKPKKT